MAEAPGPDYGRRVGDSLPAEQRRASHADREHVAERLREAAGDGRLSIDELEERLDAAFAARTYADLERLTSDLPDQTGPVQVPARTRSGGTIVERVTGREGRRWSVALMSGTTRKGRWALGRDHVAVAVMGGVDLDLRDAELESGEVVIRVLALMGGVDIVVPDDCVLDASGFGVMGGFDHHDRAGEPPPGAPVIKVRGLAVMGGVDAVRRPRSHDALGTGDDARELER
jgi:hypothetical protein